VSRHRRAVRYWEQNNKLDPHIPTAMPYLYSALGLMFGLVCTAAVLIELAKAK
jgi:hypothetical protein